MLTLKNPHSVLAALETRPQDVQRISVPGAVLRGGDAEGAEGRDAWNKVVQLARASGVQVMSTAGNEQRGGARNQGPKEGRVGGAEAFVEEREGISVEELFAGAREKDGGKGLWIALDNLQDPHNVGAIFRTAGFFGVQGILLTQDRSAPLSSTVYDVAAGGMERVPFTLQINLQRAFEVAKENGLWILGTSERAKDSLKKIERDRPWLLVLGNEEKGMRRLTEEACDVVCRIDARGEVPSLNVSVAAGILMAALSGD